MRQSGVSEAEKPEHRMLIRSQLDRGASLLHIDKQGGRMVVFCL